MFEYLCMNMNKIIKIGINKCKCIQKKICYVFIDIMKNSKAISGSKVVVFSKGFIERMKRNVKKKTKNVWKIYYKQMLHV